MSNRNERLAKLDLNLSDYELNLGFRAVVWQQMSYFSTLVQYIFMSQNMTVLVLLLIFRKI